MAGKAVIALVRADHRHRRFDLCQQPRQFRPVMVVASRQGMGQNLTRFGVNRQMQLAPNPPFALAMLAHLPFALAEQLQPGRVDGQMQGPLLRPTLELRHRQISRPSRQGRVMRHRDREPQHGLETAQEPLRLPQRQLVDRPNAQGAQDRRIAVAL